MLTKGCLQCGYRTREPRTHCPDCDEPLVMALDADQLGAEGALERQKQYCADNGIERDWADPLHPRTDR